MQTYTAHRRAVSGIADASVCALISKFVVARAGSSALIRGMREERVSQTPSVPRRYEVAPDAVVALVKRTTHASGVPERIEDPAVVAEIAEVFRSTT